MKKIRLRRAVANDLSCLLNLEKTAFRYNLISRRSFRRFLCSPTAAVVLATAKEKVVGYALVLFSSRRTCARLYSLAVSPECTRMGVGAALLNEAEKMMARRKLASLRLEVEVKNVPALRLYADRGYKVLRKLTAYYEHGADALRLEKVLR